jgi:hypothetical protein
MLHSNISKCAGLELHEASDSDECVNIWIGRQMAQVGN